MALSKLDVPVVLTEQYFNLVYSKYGIPFPDDAPWKEVKNIRTCNGFTQVLQEVPNTLFEIADLFEDARVEELIKKCERLRINSGNMYRQYTGTISVLFEDGLTWGKVVVFFSFSVSFAIYLCIHDMSDLAARVCVWAAQVLQDRLQPWVDENRGWESLLSYGKEVLSHKNGVKQREAVARVGQAGLMLGMFAIAAFTIKHIFS